MKLFFATTFAALSLFACSAPPSAITETESTGAQALAVATCSTTFFVESSHAWAQWETTLDTADTLTAEIRTLDNVDERTPGNVVAIGKAHTTCLALRPCTVSVQIPGDPNVYPVTLSADRKRADVVQPYPGLVAGFTNEASCR